MGQFRVIILLLVASFSGGGHNIYAQSSQQDLRLSHALQDSVREFVGRFIPANNFQVIVRASADSKKLTSRPYVPGAFSAAFLKTKSLREQAFYASGIKITIWFIKEITDSTRSQIISLLEAESDLNRSRGDTIATEVLNISLSELDSGTGNLTRKMETVQGDLEKVKAERDEAKRSLTSLQLNFDQALKETALNKEMLRTRDQQYSEVKRKLDDLEKNESALKEEYNKLKEQWDQSSIRKIFSLFGSSLFISIAGLICALIFVMGLTRSFASVTAGMKKVSENISAALSAIANSLTMKPEADIASDDHEKEIDIEKSTEIAQSVPGIEELKIYSTSLREEVDKLWKEEFESDVVIYIDNLIRKYKKPSHAMIVFEIMGQEKSEKVFRRLSKQAKQSVNHFIRNAVYDKPKSVLMIEAGENLKTLLFAEYISKSDTNLSQEVTEAIVKLEFDFLIQMILELDEKLIPRFLLYLDPGKISDLMKYLSKHNQKRFRDVASALADIPEAQDDDSQDQDIKKKIDETLVMMQKDLHKPYYQFYKEVLEKTGDELSEDIMSDLARKNEGLGNYLRSSVITFNSLFILSENQISSLVGKLTNHEVGVIISSLHDEAHKKRLLESFGARRQQMIMDELDVVSGRPPGQVKDQFDKIRDRITKSLKDSGVIDSDPSASNGKSGFPQGIAS